MNYFLVSDKVRVQYIHVVATGLDTPDTSAGGRTI